MAGKNGQAIERLQRQVRNLSRDFAILAQQVADLSGGCDDCPNKGCEDCVKQDTVQGGTDEQRD